MLKIFCFMGGICRSRILHGLPGQRARSVFLDWSRHMAALWYSHVHPLVIQSGPQSQRITIAANGMTVGEMMLTKETVFASFVPPLDWRESAICSYLSASRRLRGGSGNKCGGNLLYSN